MSKCLECGYYDKEKHYCPFYCQLIRETLNEAISFELEQIKEEIKKQYSFYTDYGVICGCESSCEIIDKHIKELKGESE